MQALKHKGKNVFPLHKSSLSPSSDLLLERVVYKHDQASASHCRFKDSVGFKDSVKEGRDAVKKLTVTPACFPTSISTFETCSKHISCTTIFLAFNFPNPHVDGLIDQPWH